MFFEVRFDLGTLDSGERSLPFGLLVCCCFFVVVFFRCFFFLVLFWFFFSVSFQPFYVSWIISALCCLFFLSFFIYCVTLLTDAQGVFFLSLDTALGHV